ncbi:hypothetical protein [Streptomyces sp. NPDC001502]|uniref:hypothetical protein n=1 Tax=Streptomyces sp. NPDC001502 TaxID=3364578 RepID=UPI00368A5A52
MGAGPAAPAVEVRAAGTPPQARPVPASPPGGWLQPALFEVCRDFTRVDPDQHTGPDNPWLAWARHTAHRLGEARGWPRKVRFSVDRALIILMSRHIGGDAVRHSELYPALRPRRLNMELTIEVLDHIGVFLDDRTPSFEHWLQRKLDGIAPGIRRDVEHWIRLLHDGGPRSQPRDEATVWNYLNRIRPVLIDWSSRYDHLREVTRDDVLAQLDALHGSQRQHTLIVLRSLFGRAKKNGTIFKNPTGRIRVGQRESGIIQSLDPEHIDNSVASVTKPADRLVLALAAVHAARSGAIRRLQLDDLDLGNRKLTIDGRSRRLDDLTLRVAREWLEFRRHRWPDTANPHLLINKITALAPARSARSPSPHRFVARPPPWNSSASTDSSKKLSPTVPTPSTSPRSSAWTRRPRSATRTPPALSWNSPWKVTPRLHHEPAGPPPNVRAPDPRVPAEAPSVFTNSRGSRGVTQIRQKPART